MWRYLYLSAGYSTISFVFQLREQCSQHMSDKVDFHQRTYWQDRTDMFHFCIPFLGYREDSPLSLWGMAAGQRSVYPPYRFLVRSTCTQHLFFYFHHKQIGHQRSPSLCRQVLAYNSQILSLKIKIATVNYSLHLKHGLYLNL